MPARILDGKSISASLRAEIERDVRAFRTRSAVTPGLAVVMVGEDPASQVYVRNKRQACRAAGIDASLHGLAADTPQEKLLDLIARLNADPKVHGILVQLPLPHGVSETRVVESIDPCKDVDGFHPYNVGLLASGRPRFVPCTPLGIREMLKCSGIETRGLHAVVMGRSNVVGKPMALLLMQKGAGGDATVTVIHTATRDPRALAREADLLIVAAGQPELVAVDWVKPGAVVIDVGIHRRADRSLCGDVHFASVSQAASWISPVPGGVGLMTVTMLLKNTLEAAKLQCDEPTGEFVKQS